MSHRVKEANQALLEAAERLVEEHDDLSAGSVRRCFSRCVRQALHDGCPTTHVAAEVENMTRALLERRSTAGARPTGRTVSTRLPRPRPGEG